MATLKSLPPALRRPRRGRRALIAGLGGITLGGIVTPVQASEKSRKAVKRAKKQSKKKCQNQEGQCVQALTEICTARISDPADVAACIVGSSPCCAFLADCQVTPFFDCLNTPR